MYESQLKASSELKTKGYYAIANCKEKDKRVAGMNMIESLERVSLRGVYFEIENDKVILRTALGTTEKLLSTIIIPLLSEFGLAEERAKVEKTLNDICCMNKKTKYRCELTKLIRDIYRNGFNTLMMSNRITGKKKAIMFGDRILYIQGGFAERKLIANNNKQKRLKSTFM